MANVRCPGQDTRFWKPKDIFESPCPHCGASIEFWKDDPFRKCARCKQKVRNPKLDFGCAKWCKYAKECLGYVPATNEAEESVCNRLISAMKTLFGTDRRRVAHALKVLEYAEEILAEEGGSPLVVKAAAILHDIGIKEAERKHGSAAGRYQETEGPPIAKKIMEDIGLEEGAIEHVCRIVGSHHSARDIDTTEFRILWDADWLVNMGEERAGKSREELLDFIERTFRTETGKSIAKKSIVSSVGKE